jgi:hypothetical protein
MLDAHGDAAQGHKRQTRAGNALQTLPRWVPSVGGFLPIPLGTGAVNQC